MLWETAPNDREATVKSWAAHQFFTQKVKHWRQSLSLAVSTHPTVVLASAIRLKQKKKERILTWPTLSPLNGQAVDLHISIAGSQWIKTIRMGLRFMIFKSNSSLKGFSIILLERSAGNERKGEKDWEVKLRQKWKNRKHPQPGIEPGTPVG